MLHTGQRRLWVASLAIVVALAASSCGGEDDSTPTGAGDAAVDATEVPGAVPPGGNDGAADLSFTDITEAAGVTWRHLSPLGEKEDGKRMMGGAAAGDLDNDGFVDLYVIGGGEVEDAVFHNNGDGTFTNIAEAAGVSGLHVGSGVTMADYDGDGWLDMYVTSHGPPYDLSPGRHKLFHNNGDGTFTDVAVEAGVATTSIGLADGFGSAFGDYDLDGDLDLFVAGWRKETQGNRLFRNDGDGTFTDVTDDSGIVDDGIRGFAPCWTDMDGDRFPELLLVADFGTSRYFVNQADGTFAETSGLVGAGAEWSGMGTAIGDFNNDLYTDWYVTAIFDNDAEGRGDGNKLYLGQDNGSFVEVAGQLGVDDGGWGWGAVAVDLDHDGWMDIVETNGWPLPAYEDELARVWLNQRGERFYEAAEAAGLDHRIHGLSVVRFDADNDGDQDIAITAANDSFRLYRNDLQGAGTNWLRVFLDTSADPNLAPGGIGARVVATVDGVSYLRTVDGCANYLSADEPSAHFGLGNAESVDEIRVEWPDGTVTTNTDVAVNQTVIVAAAAP